MQPVRDVTSDAELSGLVGPRFTVDAVALGRTALLQRPLTGPVADALPPGIHLLTAGEVTLSLRLEPVARDLRFVHYEAWPTDPVESDLLVAG